MVWFIRSWFLGYNTGFRNAQRLKRRKYRFCLCVVTHTHTHTNVLSHFRCGNFHVFPLMGKCPCPPKNTSTRYVVTRDNNVTTLTMWQRDNVTTFFNPSSLKYFVLYNYICLFIFCHVWPQMCNDAGYICNYSWVRSNRNWVDVFQLKPIWNARAGL